MHWFPVVPTIPTVKIKFKVPIFPHLFRFAFYIGVINNTVITEMSFIGLGFYSGLFWLPAFTVFTFIVFIRKLFLNKKQFGYTENSK